MSADQSPQDQQEFLNCEMGFECPKDWFALEPTDKVGIKHCNQCQKEVHLCINQEELNQTVEQQLCVAFFKHPTLLTKLNLKSWGNEKDSEIRSFTRMTVGYPSSQRQLELTDAFASPSRRAKLSTSLDEE
jgi:hypothetical protein